MIGRLVLSWRLRRARVRYVLLFHADDRAADRGFESPLDCLREPLLHLGELDPLLGTPLDDQDDPLLRQVTPPVCLCLADPVEAGPVGHSEHYLPLLGCAQDTALEETGALSSRVLYGVVSAQTEKIVEFFLEREAAEAMIGEVSGGRAAAGAGAAGRGDRALSWNL